MSTNVNIPGHFFKHPNRSYHLRELAALLRLNPVTVKRKLAGPVRAGLLKVSRERRFLLYHANTDSPSFRRLKIEWNINRIHDSGLVDHINDRLNLPVVILFGSWARGENQERSDLDLFVLTESKAEVELSKFEKTLEAPIQLFRYNRRDFETLTRKNKELANNIINGRVLAGFLEVFR